MRLLRLVEGAGGGRRFGVEATESWFRKEGRLRLGVRAEDVEDCVRGGVGGGVQGPPERAEGFKYGNRKAVVWEAELAGMDRGGVVGAVFSPLVGLQSN